MKYFISIKGINYQKKILFYSPIWITEIVSIGIVCEDGRKFYAISKDFNIDKAWNLGNEKVNMSYKSDFGGFNDGPYNPMYIKEYSYRDNIIKNLFNNYVNGYNNDINTIEEIKRLLDRFGKTSKQISKEIIEFTKCDYQKGIQKSYTHYDSNGKCTNNSVFYGYYSIFDYSVFSQFFRFFDVYPKGFPVYFINMKQELDDKVTKLRNNRIEKSKNNVHKINYASFEEYKKSLFNHSEYPKQTNEHHALFDATWIKDLHQFINSL